MPGGDRKGPRGGGPKTGRGLGYCAESDQPGYAASRPFQRLGLGFRRGRCGRSGGFGRGRGGRNRFSAGFRSGRGRDAYVGPREIQDQVIDPRDEQIED